MAVYYDVTCSVVYTSQSGSLQQVDINLLEKPSYNVPYGIFDSLFQSVGTSCEDDFAGLPLLTVYHGVVERVPYSNSTSTCKRGI